jgi:ribosome-binding protein aMBF1 (putative translation factor)
MIKCYKCGKEIVTNGYTIVIDAYYKNIDVCTACLLNLARKDYNDNLKKDDSLIKIKIMASNLQMSGLDPLTRIEAGLILAELVEYFRRKT